ncbi:T9SS type A sorting domain-containing protein [bacterium]|nr:T9SS type A sorting domain-containing protein [bacterium]
MITIPKNIVTPLVIFSIAAFVSISRADTPLYPKSPDIQVEPLEIESELYPGEITRTSFNISNTGDSILNWRPEIVITLTPDNEDRTPENRDNAGDVLARYIVPHAYTCGLAWDGELMWAVSRHESRLFAFDPERISIAHDYQIHELPYGLTIVGDELWVGASNRVMIYNREGELIDHFAPPFLRIHDDDLYSMAYDKDSLVYINSWDEHTVFVINAFTREQVARFDILEDLDMEGFNVSHLEWVPNHRDGHLWAIIGSWDEGFFAYQLSVDENWHVEEINHFEFLYEGYVGIAHDGDNLWHGGDYRGQLWYVYDDGDAECYWMSVSPRNGSELQPNDDMDVFITLDAGRLTPGLWETKIHVLSDDPDNPDIEVAVIFEVTGDNIKERNEALLPDLIELTAYPNPFNAVTTIHFSIHERSPVSLRIYNLNGRLVEDLSPLSCLKPGQHEIIWNARTFSTGNYFIRFENGGRSMVRQTLVLK